MAIAPNSSSLVYTLHYYEDVAVIRLRNPVSIFNNNFIDKFNEALDLVENNSKINILITTCGSLIFSIGPDRQWLAEQAIAGNLQAISDFYKRLHKLYIRVLTFPLPTIAALNGHAISAGGCLALAHDVRLMSKFGASVWLPEVSVSLPLGEFEQKMARLKLPADGYHQLVALGRRIDSRFCLKAGAASGIYDNFKVTEGAIVWGKKLIKDRPIPRWSLQAAKLAQCKDLIALHQTMDYTVTPEVAEVYKKLARKVRVPSAASHL